MPDTRISEFGLKAPCADCPFRKDKRFELGSRRRAEELAQVARSGGFDCHKTVDWEEDGPGQVKRNGTQKCAGATITAVKGGELPFLIRVALQLGHAPKGYLDDLDYDSALYDSLDAWVASYEDDGHRMPSDDLDWPDWVDDDDDIDWE